MNAVHLLRQGCLIWHVNSTGVCCAKVQLAPLPLHHQSVLLKSRPTKSCICMVALNSPPHTTFGAYVVGPDKSRATYPSHCGKTQPGSPRSGRVSFAPVGPSPESDCPRSCGDLQASRTTIVFGKTRRLLSAHIPWVERPVGWDARQACDACRSGMPIVSRSEAAYAKICSQVFGTQVSVRCPKQKAVLQVLTSSIFV